MTGSPALSDQLTQLMRQLDLPASTAAVYAHLLRNGPSSAQSLSAAIGATPQHVEAALARLSRMNVVGTGRIRTQTRYYATNPSLAWVALTADLVWGATTTLEPVWNLPDTGRPRVEHVREICTFIREAANDLYVEHSEIEAHQEHDATTSEQLAQLTCELIAASRHSIFAVSKSPLLPQVSSFWTTLTSRMAHGVSYIRIADLDELISHGIRVKVRDMDVAGVQLHVLEPSSIRHKFYLVDRKLLSIEAVPQTADATRSNVGRITTSRPIVARYHRHFRAYLGASMPGDFALDQLKQSGFRLVEQAHRVLPRPDALWIEDLVAWGQFSKFHQEVGWSPQRLSEAERRASSQKLVQRNVDGKIVPHYDLDETSLRTAYRQLEA